jgi:protein-tyrosine-phosphatase
MNLIVDAELRLVKNGNFLSRRNMFLVMFLLISLFSCKHTSTNHKKIKDMPEILFVCEHGAARSTIATAYFNKLAKEQGLNYRAVFRATNPDSTLMPAAIKGLTEDGFDISNWTPKLVSQTEIDRASEIVTFNCNIPVSANSSKPPVPWNEIPPVSEDYDLARDQIVRNVQKLINDLAKKRIKEND